MSADQMKIKLFSSQRINGVQLNSLSSLNVNVVNHIKLV